MKMCDAFSKFCDLNLFVPSSTNSFRSLKIDYKITSRRSGDLARSYADPSKANAELNWEARYNLETMCKDAWEAIKKWS